MYCAGHLPSPIQLFLDMENVLIFIDDVLVVTHGSFDEHLRTLRTVIDRLISKGMQVNAKKCEWFKSEVEYLGYVINKQGVRPQKSKVEKILSIKEPTNASRVRSFLGMMNYYRYMWKQRSTLIAPLTELSTKGKRKFIWMENHSKAFRKIKQVVAKETLLVYPDFTKHFDVHTDSSDYQLGGVVSQNQKPIAFFSRKLNFAQRNYTVTKKGLLAIVETLKEFRYILYGHRVIVYTDHKNLCSTTAQHEGQRVMRQRLIMEEYGIEIRHIEGEKNYTADALSRLDFEDKIESFRLECFASQDTDDVNDFDVLQLHNIARLQQKKMHLYKEYDVRREPCGRFLFVHKNRVVIPKELRDTMLRWYHETLNHPAVSRMKATIKKHFYWPGMDSEIETLVKKCDTCQKFKKTAVKPVGHLPVRNVRSSIPWQQVRIDCIGPWKLPIFVATEDKTIHVRVSALTMVCEATLLPEITRVFNSVLLL